MRNEILLQAEQQMMIGGFHGLNFGTIAKTLNTTRANLHYHFKNKESLALEVAKNYTEKQFQDFHGLASAFGNDFFGFVKVAEDMFWKKSYEIGSTSICVATKMSSEPTLPEGLQKLATIYYYKFEDMHRNQIENAIANGQIRSDVDPVREATRCHLILMGAMSCGQMIGDVAKAHKELNGYFMEWAESLK